MSDFLIPVPYLGDFWILCWFVLFTVNVMVFVLSYCIYFMMVCCHFLETCCFLVGDLNQVDPDERRGAEELWEVEGGEAVFRLYCIRRKSRLIKGVEKKFIIHCLYIQTILFVLSYLQLNFRKWPLVLDSQLMYFSGVSFLQPHDFLVGCSSLHRIEESRAFSIHNNMAIDIECADFSYNNHVKRFTKREHSFVSVSPLWPLLQSRTKSQ